MKNILGKIWLAWGGFWFALIFLILYPLFMLWLSHPRLYPIAHFQRRIWGILSCIPMGYLPIVTKEAKIPKGRRVVYCPNHSSYLDILTAGTYLPGFNFFMAKMELSKVPLFNIWFKTIDVPVKRESLRNSHKAFVDAAEKFDTGIDMIIFPEGRIPTYTPALHPLKNGAFKLAIEKGALIIPVTMPDNYKRLDVHAWIASPGKMRMHIHRPIDTAGLNLDDADALKDQVTHIIEQKLTEFGVDLKKYENNKPKS
ncbi:MAG: 1-acyl-sn-glycerol-3-phosphate acyltransferase [Bacteroidia bacterium]|nr:1-acyl-sn-glycerol-3-phosphate acyltransferase [Bacteroidia bacterium]